MPIDHDLSDDELNALAGMWAASDTVWGFPSHLCFDSVATNLIDTMLGQGKAEAILHGLEEIGYIHYVSDPDRGQYWFMPVFIGQLPITSVPKAPSTIVETPDLEKRKISLLRSLLIKPYQTEQELLRFGEDAFGSVYNTRLVIESSQRGRFVATEGGKDTLICHALNLLDAMLGDHK